MPIPENICTEKSENISERVPELTQLKLYKTLSRCSFGFF